MVINIQFMGLQPKRWYGPKKSRWGRDTKGALVVKGHDWYPHHRLLWASRRGPYIRSKHGKLG